MQRSKEMLKMRRRCVELSLLLSVVAGGLPAADCIDGASLKWRVGANAKITDGVAIFDVPTGETNGTAYVTADVDLEQVCGRDGYEASVEMRGRAISEPAVPWGGAKFMISYTAEPCGETVYPQAKTPRGTFARTNVVYRRDFEGWRPKKATVTLGLERASGRLGVDLKTLRIVRAKPAFPFVNPAGRAVYTKRVTEMPQLKGAMISSDIPTWSFEELIDRGARLVRFTLHGYNMKPEQRGDWKDPDFKKVRKQYFDWLDRRLSQFEGLVPLARKRGVKMIPALFNLTGGKYPGTDEDAMFRDPKWADLFVETWMRIAWRLRAHTDVIYGYDLVNEPLDRTGGAGDYYALQERCARRIRQIDPVTPIILEPNRNATPSGFAYLTPLDLPDVIYTIHPYQPMRYTHQGLGKKAGEWTEVVYPSASCDREFLERTLAAAREFQIKYGARILVGEFSAVVWAKGSVEWLSDNISFFDAYGWDWCYHAWREFAGWSAEHEGVDFDHLRKADGETPRLKMLTEAWRKRTYSGFSNWRTVGKGATIEGTVARVRVGRDAKGENLVLADVDLSQYDFNAFRVSVKARAKDVKRLSDKPAPAHEDSTSHGDGVVFAIRFQELLWGNVFTTYAEQKPLPDGWTELTFTDDHLHGKRAKGGTIRLGLENATGEVEFDLSTLKIEFVKGLPTFQVFNRDWKVSYPEEVKAWPQLMGTMLPLNPTEKDFSDLHDMGATLVRYQFLHNGLYNWKKNFSEDDGIAQYREWFAKRLENMHSMLDYGRKYGIRIIVNYQWAPGGHTSEKHNSTKMFVEKKYADLWVDNWREIARRFKDNNDIIYGYDLVNEPLDRGGKQFTVYGLQETCAKAVREIDPVTPIVFEPNNNGQETGYEFMSPLRMDNVIYSVHVYHPTAYTHQGLFTDKAKYHPEPWPNAEKGWDREYLRRKLQPIRDFQLRTGARILVGEFSSVAYAPGANNYLEDVLSLFREYGWDWAYHAFRESSCWSMEHEGDSYYELRPTAEKTPRAVLLEDFMRHGMKKMSLK